MRIGEVIGTVTPTRLYPKMQGGRLLIVRPYDPKALRGQEAPTGEPVVVYDELGAGVGCRVAFTEGREGAMPFWPDEVPVDAYLGAILDDVHLGV